MAFEQVIYDSRMGQWASRSWWPSLVITAGGELREEASGGKLQDLAHEDWERGAEEWG